MSHYAKIEQGYVTQVIVADQDFINTQSGQWIQTSYNTRGNVHYGSDNLPDGGVPLRGNYAGVGFIYDSANDVFYAPQPFPSWLLDHSTWLWKSPVALPDDGNHYIWDESKVNWDQVSLLGNI